MRHPLRAAAAVLRFGLDFCMMFFTRIRHCRPESFECADAPAFPPAAAKCTTGGNRMKLPRLTAGTLALLPFLAFAQSRPTVLKLGTAYDGKGKTIRNTTIVIEGSKIARIGGPAPSGAISYDLSALTVSPGWIDTHSHIAYHFGDDGRNGGRGEPPSKATLRAVDNAVMTLEAGFTTIQSPGQLSDKDLRDAIA